MNKSRSSTLIAVFVLLGVSASVSAQPATDAFLEQRVVEELATEGTLLTRLGVELDIELVANTIDGKATRQAIVSLLDPATHRAVASTKLGQLPAERDAAAAAVTVVAANLVSQLAAPSAPANAAAVAVQEVLRDERSHREEREQAEWHYRREAITFGEEVVGTGTHTRTAFRAYQGGRPMQSEELLLALGRKDLADDLSSRKTRAGVGIFGGAIAFIVGSGVLMNSTMRDDGTAKTALRIGGGGLMAAGVIGVIVGVHAMVTLPFNEGDLYDMADQHNGVLRKKYGLPTTSSRAPHKVDHSIVVAPYALGSGGGLAVAGQF